ncbi:MAG: nuclear transport factor 2 family protein, partial [Steroidobacteraceae bacterium]
EEIKQYLADQMNPMILFDTTTEMSMVRGDLALETGTYKFRDTRRGADIEYGKYMTVWRKDGNDWKIYRAMFNTDEPTETKVTVAHEGG